ncbi:MAG: hypothetical protein C0405_13075 [Desulfovibrio sp.]|nr:hypothetical protein [Desulfovibrio sp.]
MALPGASDWKAPVLAAACACALFLALFLVPVLGSFASFWTPAPLALLYRRRGRDAGRLALGLTLVLALVLGAMLSAGVAGMFILYYLVVALALGEAPGLNLSAPRTLGLAAFMACGVLFGLILGVAWMSGQGLLEMAAEQWQEQLAMILKSSAALGLDDSQVQALKQGMERAGHALARLSPGLVLCFSLLVAWANLMLTRVTAAPVGDQPRLNRWRSPEPLVWVVILAGALIWAGDGWVYWLALNVLLALGAMYFFQGMAILAFWLEKKNAPRLLRVGIYTLLAVELVLALLVALAGLFDIWFNFRRLGDNSPTA